MFKLLLSVFGRFVPHLLVVLLIALATSAVFLKIEKGKVEVLQGQVSEYITSLNSARAENNTLREDKAYAESLISTLELQKAEEEEKWSAIEDEWSKLVNRGKVNVTCKKEVGGDVRAVDIAPHFRLLIESACRADPSCTKINP